MSVINTQPLVGASGQSTGPYTLSKSLRFRSSASAYLSRTPASASNRTVWTWSGWVKRANLSTYQALLDVYIDTNNASIIDFTDSNALRINNLVGGVAVTNKITSAVYRDPAAWYHVVVSSNGATSLNLYVNGVQVTAWGTNTGPDASNWFFNSVNAHWIGREQYSATNYYSDNYLTNVQFIDGQALSPSSFGATDTTTGAWQPIAYTGSYGTNGFYLPFTNTTSTATLGNDSSGNSNTWTVNNISLTAGSTYDSMTDVPTLTSATAANYCVLNAVMPGDYFASGQSALALTNGNLNYGATGRNAFGSMAVSSGKWYYEFSNTANTGAAVTLSGLVTVAARTAVYGVYYNSSNGYKGLGTLNSGATETAYGATWTDNDIIGVALDMDAATPTVTFYKNNSSQGAISVSSFVGQTVFAWVQNGANSNNMSGYFNFGQRPFTYSAPSGFVALNTYNL